MDVLPQLVTTSGNDDLHWIVAYETLQTHNGCVAAKEFCELRIKILRPYVAADL